MVTLLQLAPTLGLILGSGLTYFGYRKWKDVLAIENTPTSTVRSIAMGPTELDGSIRCDKPIESPLTGEPAVCYTYSIEEAEEDEDGHTHWRTIKSGRAEAPASLEDDTGTVQVDLDGITIENAHEFNEDIGVFDSPSDELKSQLEKLDITTTTLFGTNRDLRFTEQRIEPDDDVYLYGTARDNPEVEEGTGTQNEDDILICKDNNRFIIAQGDEADLTSSLRTTMYVLLGAGITFVTASLIGFAFLL